MKQTILDFNEYYIDERINYRNYHNNYRILDIDNVEIGFIEQTLATKNKIANFFFSRRHTPFSFEIRDTNYNLLGVIYRGWSLFNSTVEVRDAENTIIGRIIKKLSLFRLNYKIYNSINELIADANAIMMTNKYEITNSNRVSTCDIKRIHGNLLKELFTSADKYFVSLSPLIDGSERLLYMACVIAIDNIEHEKR